MICHRYPPCMVINAHVLHGVFEHARQSAQVHLLCTRSSVSHAQGQTHRLTDGQGQGQGYRDRDRDRDRGLSMA